MLESISPTLPKPAYLPLQNIQPSSSASPKPAQNPPKHHDRCDDNPRQFQHSHFVALARHDAKPARAAFDARGHVGEGLGGVVDDVLVARIVVDVDGDAAQGGDFGGEGGEGVVVLSGGVVSWVFLSLFVVRGIGLGITFRVRRLRTWLRL